MRYLLYCLLFCVFITNLYAQDNISPKYAREVSLKFVYTFKKEKGLIDKVSFLTLVPHNIKNRQSVKSLEFSVQPDSIIYNGNNAYAAFTLHNVPQKIEINAKLSIYKFIATNNTTTDTSFEPYLIGEKFIESHSSKILEIARKLKDKNDIETVINTFNFVQENVTYKLGNSIGADSVLTSGQGKCSDFSDLFVALLRANEIPAKPVIGILVDKGYNYINPFHQWAEVYLRKQGWVLFDPTTGYRTTQGHTNVHKEGNKYKITEQNKYVILSDKRTDNFLNSGNEKYWLYNLRYHGSDGCKLSFKFKWDCQFDD